MGRRKKEAAAEGGANWMDTYGDLVTNLLCFFVLLYAFSSVDEGKWMALVAAFAQTPTTQVAVLDSEAIVEEFQQRMAEADYEALQQMARAAGLNRDSYEVSQAEMAAVIMALESANAMAPANLQSPDGTGDTPSNMPGAGIGQFSGIAQSFDELYGQMQRYVQDNGLQSSLDLVRENDAITLRFKDNLLFDSGEVDLLPDALVILQDISGLLQTYESAIRLVRIVGHTDNRPIRNDRFENNMELSFGRAYSVWIYLVEQNVLPSEKMQTSASGESAPIDTNDTAEGRARNRRVELIIERERLYTPITGITNNNVAPLPEDLADAVE